METENVEVDQEVVEEVVVQKSRKQRSEKQKEQFIKARQRAYELRAERSKKKGDSSAVNKQKHADFSSRVRPPGCKRLPSSPRGDEVPLLDLRRRTKSSKPLDLRRGERTCENVRGRG